MMLQVFINVKGIQFLTVKTSQKHINDDKNINLVITNNFFHTLRYVRKVAFEIIRIIVRFKCLIIIIHNAVENFS
ncbi:Uncharacterised protein [Mycobacteroides abscessus subsp. abscessus]|nr:Uncharacterised protein [Mycobacteroides abscessus subsp. abscessus]